MENGGLGRAGGEGFFTEVAVVLELDQALRPRDVVRALLDREIDVDGVAVLWPCCGRAVAVLWPCCDHALIGVDGVALGGPAQQDLLRSHLVLLGECFGRVKSAPPPKKNPRNHSVLSVFKGQPRAPGRPATQFMTQPVEVDARKCQLFLVAHRTARIFGGKRVIKSLKSGE